MTNKLHIDQIYLDGIKKGIKKHEYRLATPKRRSINIGDIITLKSDIESLDVTITGIKIYPSWYEALKNTWEQDFKGIYSSLEETIKACEKFYTKQDIDKYQIIVFEIKNEWS